MFWLTSVTENGKGSLVKTVLSLLVALCVGGIQLATDIPALADQIVDEAFATAGRGDPKDAAFVADSVEAFIATPGGKLPAMVLLVRYMRALANHCTMVELDAVDVNRLMDLAKRLDLQNSLSFRANCPPESSETRK